MLRRRKEESFPFGSSFSKQFSILAFRRSRSFLLLKQPHLVCCVYCHKKKRKERKVFFNCFSAEEPSSNERRRSIPGQSGRFPCYCSGVRVCKGMSSGQQTVSSRCCYVPHTERPQQQQQLLNKKKKHNKKTQWEAQY